MAWRGRLRATQYGVGLPIWVPTAVTAIGLALMLLPLFGCTGLNDREQREVSGAAVGGIVAGPVGAGIGALIGLLIDLNQEDGGHE